MTTKITRPRRTRARSDDQPPVNQAAIDLLQSWLDAEEEEVQDQQDTFEALKQGIDEERARLGMRLLFS